MHAGVLILAAALAPADPLPPLDGLTPPEKAEPAFAAEDIRGEWEVVGVRWDGEDRTRLVVGGRWIFTRDWVFIKTAQTSTDSAYRLDRSKPMPEIDEVSEGGNALRGIYTCTGDRLIVAETRRMGGPRPKAFESEPGSGVRLWILRRIK
jgi:uncharacterized protein (TIGR03067 family)